jgi:4-amino-4-deoxy-L-arabinose transferase-like glycosyltransferase
MPRPPRHTGPHAAPPAAAGGAPHSLPRALVGVLLLGFAVRLAFVLWCDETIPYTDYFYYHEAGRLQAADWTFLLQRDTVERFGKLNWWPPGYPVFLAALYTLAGPDFRLAVLVQVLLGTAVCGLAWGLGRRAAGPGAGVAAGVLAALDPTWIAMTNLMASENLYVAWLGLALWLAGRDATPRRHAWTGVVLGLGTLTRAIGLGLPLVVAVWMRRRAPSPAVWRRTVVWLLGACALTIAPWTLRNAVVAGTPALVCFGGGLNFYFGHNDDGLGYREVAKTPMAGLADVAAIDRRGWALGLQHLGRHPLGFVTDGVRKIGALFAPPTYALHANSAILVPDYQSDPRLEPAARAKLARQKAKDEILHGPLALLAAVHSYFILATALFAVVVWRRRLPAELQLAAWVGLYWIAAHVVFWAQPRFRYPMELPLALLAGFALAQLAGRRRSRAA